MWISARRGCLLALTRNCKFSFSFRVEVVGKAFGGKNRRGERLTVTRKGGRGSRKIQWGGFTSRGIRLSCAGMREVRVGIEAAEPAFCEKRVLAEHC